MLTVEDIKEYLRHVLAEELLEGNALRLRDTQRAAGLLMRAAEWAGDEEAARSFRLIAAEAANHRELV